MSLNRHEGQSAVEANLDGAPVGFRVTGDAAMIEDSTDFAMFSDEGNLAVATMVALVRKNVGAGTLDEDQAYSFVQELFLGIVKVHGEIADTMVRETIAYALDGVWTERFGHPIDQWNIPRYS